MDVHVLAVDHRHGMNLTAHTTEALARAELALYCRSWWAEARDWDENLPTEAPTDDDDVIEAYFDAVEPESYVIEAMVVHGDVDSTLATDEEKAAAREVIQKYLRAVDDVEIDEDAKVSHADDGYWVQGWIWVLQPEEREEETTE